MDRLVLGLFGLFIWLFGFIAVSEGIEAIRMRQFDLDWRYREGLHLGPVVQGGPVTERIEHYRGTAAIRMGVGISAFGGILVGWGLPLILTSISPKVLGAGFNVRKSALILLPLLFAVTAAVCLWPPWRVTVDPSPTAFYATVGVDLVLFWWTVSKRRQARWIPPAIVVAALATGHFAPEVGAGILFGFVFSLLAGVHIYVFMRSWRLRHWL